MSVNIVYGVMTMSDQYIIHWKHKTKADTGKGKPMSEDRAKVMLNFKKATYTDKEFWVEKVNE